MIDYNKLIIDNNITSIEALYQFFWDEVTQLWVSLYENNFPKHGEITLQNFKGFAFIIDHIWPHIEEADIKKELPETRVVSFFGISNTNIKDENRKMMRQYWAKPGESFKAFGNTYDKGHFMAHGFGGPIDVNLFPQRRDINRGWSEEGKRYRNMERFVAANPGTLVFSRPVYNDLSCCPFQLEYGYCDQSMQLKVDIFPNK